jgi:hypothetical protein
VFSKVSLAPFVLAGFAALSYAAAPSNHRLRTLGSRQTLLYAAVVLGPGAMWTLGLFGNSADDYFVLRFLAHGAYWRGVGHQLVSVFTLPILVTALAGLVVARGTTRIFLIGQLLALVAFAVATDYRVATHNYYSLAAYPLVAVAAAASFEALRRWWSRGRGVTRAAAGPLVVALVALVIASARTPRDPGLATAPGEIRRAKTIGALLCHPTRVTMLAAGYGELLRYYGQVGGVSWPSGADLALAHLQGRRVETAAVRLRALPDAGTRWFVVTNFYELERQPDLASALDRYPVAFAGPGYRIHDLAPSPRPACPPR